MEEEDNMAMLNKPRAKTPKEILANTMEINKHFSGEGFVENEASCAILGDASVVSEKSGIKKFNNG